MRCYTRRSIGTTIIYKVTYNLLISMQAISNRMDAERGCNVVHDRLLRVINGYRWLWTSAIDGYKGLYVVIEGLWVVIQG